MGETASQVASQIETHISAERQELEQNILALENRARETVNWRAQFGARPFAALSMAFGVGIVFSRFLRG